MRQYPYTKSVLLNALYVVLERLAFPLTFADSRAGLLRFGCDDGEGAIRLTLVLTDSGEVTYVEITDVSEKLAEVLYDETNALLIRDYAGKQAS